MVIEPVGPPVRAVSPARTGPTRYPSLLLEAWRLRAQQEGERE
jgi:hypothetical protein